MRLRNSLLLFAAATAIPLVALGLLAANVVIRQENESLINVAKARNRATMSAVDGLVIDAINTLKALSVAPSLKSEELAAFHALSREVLATQPSWNNMLLHDTAGRQLVNASVPWGTPLLAKPVDPDSILSAVSSKRPAIGDLTTAPLLQNRLGIPVRVPVTRDDKVVYVLTAVLAPEAFEKLLLEQNLPSNWVSGIVNSQGRLLARVPRADVGSRASPDYLDHVKDGAREGWYRGRTLEGQDWYTAFLRSDLTGWTIGYALPAAAFIGGWHRAGWLMSAGAILSLAAAVTIGLSLSRRIATPMSQLARAAGAIGESSVPPRVESTIDEVMALSAALNKSAIDLAERDRHLRRSEEALKQHASELLQANTNKTQFLALLSHELRNPLAPLRTGLAILTMQPDTKSVADTHAMMARQVAHLARLIDDLLDVSRIDRGVLELRREFVAVDSIIGSAVETVKPDLDAKRHELVVRYIAPPSYVNGDPVRLSQILSNLLNNASKFTAPGGHIEIGTRLEGDDILISVTDTGIGFTEQDARRIFDMFVQLDAAHSTTGLGLGLTLVRSLVELHGGRIDAASEGPGQGASFTVHLPRASTPVAKIAEIAHETGITAKRRVLVVDDNVDAADSLAHLLRLHAYEVEAAHDGQRALEVARSFKPEVAFIDLNMPRIGGIDLARALIAEPWSAGLRLIAVTGMAQKSDMASTRAAGFHAHLVKPARPEEIIGLASIASDNVIPLHGERSAHRSNSQTT
jgi:signal transduction histidine kinase/CheY-like chemotaxis protein